MSVTIAPNDANILYSPYNWNRTAVRAQTNAPGAYFRVALVGLPTALTFNVASVLSEPPQVSYRIDGGPWVNAVVAASLPITAPTNSWAKHFVEVVVKSTSGSGSRWNSPWPNAALFTGITAADGTLTAPTERRPLHGLIFGDSITEGLRTLGSADPITTNDSDSKLSWAYLLGESLGAEIGMAGYASQGWTTPGSGHIPNFPDTWDVLYSGAARPVSDPVPPDFIIINHGTNDQVDPSAVATSTVNEILTAYPTTKVILVPPYGGKWAAQLSATVAAINNPRLFFVSSAGWREAGDVTDGTHNSGYVNLARVTPKLAKAVKEILDSGDGGEALSKRWIKTTGGLVRIG